MVAAAAGRIVRVKSERNGYGRAVYILHENGLITVYAHLEDFAPGIRAAIPSTRYFDTLLATPVAVQQGETIAFSGESGAGLPHLHFEVRRGFTRPVEPFSNGLGPVNDARPVPEYVTVFPATPESRVDGSPTPKIYPFMVKAAKPGARTGGAPDEYVLGNNPTVEGQVYVEVTAYQPGSTPTSRRGIYSVQLTGPSVEPGKFEYCSADELSTFDYAAPNGLVNRVFNPARSHIGPTFFTYRFGLTPGENPADCSQSVIVLSADSSQFVLTISTESGLSTTAYFTLARPSTTGNAPDKKGKNNHKTPRVPAALSFPWTMPSPGGLDLSLLAGGLTLSPRASGWPERVQIRAGAETVFDSNIDSLAGATTIPLPRAGPLQFRLDETKDLSPVEYSTVLYVGKPEAELSAVWGGVTLSIPGAAFARETPVVHLPVDLPEDARLPYATRPFKIEPVGEPLNRPARLLLRSADYAQNTGIFYWDPFVRRWRYLGSAFSTAQPASDGPTPITGDSLEDRYLSTSIRSFGVYAVLRDLAPPIVTRPEIFKRRLAIPIYDVGMGIDSDRLVVNFKGRPLAGEYDDDRGWFHADDHFTRRMTDGVLKVKVFDRAGNSTEREFVLTDLTP